MLQLSAKSINNVSRSAATMGRVARLSISANACMPTQYELLPRTQRYPNGQKVQGMFSVREMQRRVSMVRRQMDAADIDACVFTSVHNVNYLSDFLYCSFGRPYAFIVTHDKTVTVSAGIDYGQPWRKTMGDENISYTDWRKDNYYYAVQKEIERAKRVGVEFDHLTLDRHKKLADHLPASSFVDVSIPLMYMRMIKSSEEIELIKHGARIADLGGETLVKSVKENVPEHEVALASTNAMVREIATTYPDSELMNKSPDSEEDLLVSYYTSLERTLFYDHVPSDRHMELWEINCEVHRRGLELIKPGVRCCDIAQELNEIYLQHDVLQYRTFGYGHSFGVLSHYYGREAGLELREDVKTVLESNMVISMEPMITIPDGEPGAGGYREHDILVITETGAENITKFPFGPEHNVI